jgi:hypothetical protein
LDTEHKNKKGTRSTLAITTNSGLLGREKTDEILASRSICQLFDTNPIAWLCIVQIIFFATWNWQNGTKLKTLVLKIHYIVFTCKFE